VISIWLYRNVVKLIQSDPLTNPKKKKEKKRVAEIERVSWGIFGFDESHKTTEMEISIFSGKGKVEK
jgi:hypothetical protein